ncbi:hypothetical protein GVX82_02100 [Patescibacteria group bacterium]|jgi:hypothetical protein|nr:hypothetical protein [Patescibacteria group bacterium]
MIRLFSRGALLALAVLPGAASALTLSPAQVERVVAHFFPEEPTMVEVARCESGLRQHTASGAVLRGGLGGQMVGVFQLYDRYHQDAGMRMGYDIETLLGNIAYARHLFRQEGLTPWRASEHCWGSEVRPQDRDVDDEPEQQVLSRTLRFGAVHAEIILVREALAEAGQDIARGGEKFDVPLYLALTRFQCSEELVCWSSDDRRGLGVVDARTRAALQPYLN